MPESEGAGPQVIRYDTLGSTNDEALARARNGERGPLWIVAKRQEAGRGRRGRVWTSEPGNLYASVLLSAPSMPERAAELSFVAALAAHDAICARAPQLADRVRLKWPNDLLLDGAKLVGILVESEGAGESFAAVIGIGINCAHHPAGTPYRATDLAAAGVAVTVDGMLEALVAAMTRRLAQWDRGAGFAAIRTDWLAHAAGLGEDISMQLGERQVTGRFESIDRNGCLVLRQPDGTTQALAGGEVTILRGFAAEAR